MGDHSVFTKVQREVLLAIADTYLPELSLEEAVEVTNALPTSATPRQRELVTSFAREGFKTHADALMEPLMNRLVAVMSSKNRAQLQTMLGSLGSRLGCLAFTRHLGPFPTLDLHSRAHILKSWSTSSFVSLRTINTLRGSILMTYYSSHPPAWEVLGYDDGPAKDWSTAAEKEEALERFSHQFENTHLSSLPSGGEVILEADVLVIGSGAGGGVASAYLAERGLNVLVAEKGEYLSNLDMIEGREKNAYDRLYERGGLFASEDSSISILAGSTFGGGTVVNWSACLQPRDFVRASWAAQGVSYYASPAFTADLDAVARRIGASALHIKHNASNSLLALGAQRAGQRVEAVPQNTDGHTHYCGKCHFGCVSGHKRDATQTWLQDAAACGARFVQQCKIEELLFEGDRAAGARAVVNGRPVLIKARRGVILSGGSINTPAIMLRTPKLRSSPAYKHIGANLHLHPTTHVTGYYSFPIKPWEGGLLTVVCDTVEVQDPSGGWGAKLEVLASSPAIHAAVTAFDNSTAHRAHMLRYSHSFTIIVLVRDRDGGRVVLDAKGEPRVHYTASPHTQRHMVAGILKACDVHLMAGACEIATAQVGVAPFEVPPSVGGPSAAATATAPFVGTVPNITVPPGAAPGDLTEPAYQAWRAGVERAGCRPNQTMIGSAHQMGTCALGTALDASGAVRGVRGLWVADGSALPGASGVNPMMTIMATARHVARSAAKELGAETADREKAKL